VRRATPAPAPTSWECHSHNSPLIPPVQNSGRGGRYTELENYHHSSLNISSLEVKHEEKYGED